MPRQKEKYARLTTKRFRFKQKEFPRYTHYIFRYPAKFHPPIARALLERYSRPGDVVLDPFCGSGTLLVEAMASGRHAIGLDIDPVAVFISKAKTAIVSEKLLEKSAAQLHAAIEKLRRPSATYDRFQFEDITEQTVLRAARKERLEIPPIPNIYHWFRKYVVLDLARLLAAIKRLRIPRRHKQFFLACFCSSIRNASNADPVPVSGLEVTAHMKKRDEEGRIVDPFGIFSDVLNRSLKDLAALQKQVRKVGRASVSVAHGDATRLAYHVRASVDVVITSPPYHNAVDYYRRHGLEMYWLALVRNATDRLELLPRYIGRPHVRKSHRFVKKETLTTPLASKWERKIRRIDQGRADDFKHYAIAMAQHFKSLSKRLGPRAKAIVVVGKSSWNGQRIPTTKLFRELANPHFRLARVEWYPIRNRYMTYSRHNSASIDREHVLIFHRTETQTTESRNSRSNTTKAGRPIRST